MALIISISLPNSTTDADFTSTGPDQFLIRAAGGVGIGTNAPTDAILDVEGDIRTRRLVIDEGVFFEGNCSMESVSRGARKDTLVVDMKQRKSDGA